MVSCKDDEESIPDINVGFQVDPESPVAGEEVTFSNASTGGSEFAWDFGDGSTSTSENPKHTFTSSGSYTVVLVVDGFEELTFQRVVTVSDAVPEYAFDPDPIEVGVDITFTASIYNPNSAAVTYTWDFPANAIGEGLDDDGIGTGESIMVRFTSPDAEASIKLTAAIDGGTISSATTVDVKAQLAKNIYFAEKGGNIWSKKVFAKGEAELVDMGISSGMNPLTLDFEDDRLYIFDAGEFVTFSAEAETTPGSISSINFDGTGFTTHITFGLESSYDDAFFGDVVGSNIYFTDRRSDVTMIPTSTTNASWGENGGDANPEAFPTLVKNAELGYYSAWRTDGGATYGWGALNGSFKAIGDTYWWAKNSNHKGLWRFQDADIGVTDQVPASGELLTDYAVRSFEVDNANQKIYFCSNNGLGKGFYSADIDGSNIQLIDDAPADAQGGADEATYITGIVVDNESGKVYWGYRGPDAMGTDPDTGDPIPVDYETNPLWRSGIKMYNLDGTGDVEYFVQDVEVYGLAIDNEKR